MTTDTPGAIRARKLTADILAVLQAAGDTWTTYGELVALAPEGRRIVVRELEQEEGFHDEAASGAAYDAGGTGAPDRSLVETALQWIRDQLEGTGRRLEEEYPRGLGRSFRLAAVPEQPAPAPATPDPVGLAEIATRLRVQRATVDQWRQRDVLPPPDYPSVGGRPAWEWQTIREWGRQTGRIQNFDPEVPSR